MNTAELIPPTAFSDWLWRHYFQTYADLHWAPVDGNDHAWTDEQMQDHAMTEAVRQAKIATTTGDWKGITSEEYASALLELAWKIGEGLHLSSSHGNVHADGGAA